MNARIPQPNLNTRPLMAPEVDGFPQQIVGESHYQRDLEDICGGRTPDGAMAVETAFLWHERDNPYDECAVVVVMKMRVVGYLDRPMARRFCDAMRARGEPERVVACAAQIRGGWDRGDGDVGSFGVWLALRIDTLATA